MGSIAPDIRLNWSARTRWVVWSVFLLAAVWVHRSQGRLAQLHEIARIPVLDYAVVFILAGAYAFMERVRRLFGRAS